jgi:hypothetical protein
MPKVGSTIYWRFKSKKDSAFVPERVHAIKGPLVGFSAMIGPKMFWYLRSEMEIVVTEPELKLVEQ